MTEPTEPVDLLLTNAIVLTMDDDFTQYDPGAVAITGNTITAVGQSRTLEARFSPQATMDCGRKVLMPGLVNAHTHVPMTLMRGLADDLRLDVWLLGFMMPVEREFVSPQFVQLGTAIACAELIRSGVTCFADMYYYESHVAETTAQAGLRALCSQTVLKFPAPDAESYEESLEAARAFIQAWKNHPLIIPSVAPHAPYTCTDEILQACAALAVEYEVPLHTHISETAQEVRTMRSEQGMPVIPYVKKQNLFDAKVLAAHCVHIDEGEMHTLLHHQAGVAHNPSSNLKLSSGIAPVVKMLETGLQVGIGTDGPASNNDLDMFEEIRLASFIAKGTSQDPTVLPARQALAMGTRIGAHAMHMGAVTGSLEPGKRADLILVSIDPLHNAPRFRRTEDGIYAQLVYATKSTDVTDVMVDGKWLMRGRELETLDQESLLAEADAYARKIDHFLIQREQSVLSKLIAIGGASEAESFEVQTKVRILDPEPIKAALTKPAFTILYHRNYHEYDTYFLFDDPEQGSLRYREDELIDEEGEIKLVRYRLTLIGPVREYRFPSDVLLSRSRFIAPATHSLRFYREYFNPAREIFVEKNRLRWRLIFQDTEFYLNLDQIVTPELGTFLEIKSRTWSRQDAEHKAQTSELLLDYLGVAGEERITRDYMELVRKG